MSQTLNHSAGAPASYREHVSKTVSLGVPLVASQLGIMLMNTTDTVMMGWYGVTELAATVLATQVYFIFMIFGVGFAQAVMITASQAEGADDTTGVRRSVRMGLWVSLCYCALVIPLLLQTEAMLLLLAQDPKVAALAGQYMQIAVWAIIPALLSHVLRSFLSAIERPQIIMSSTLIAAVFNGLVNYALIFGNWGAPELGIEGAAIATLVSTTIMFIGMAIYTVVQKDAAPYQIFIRFWRADWSAFFDVIRIGLPIAITILAEVGMFIFASIFMGWIGIVALAAHGIALQIASIAFMVPMGLSQAATVRIGRAWGKSDAIGLHRAAVTVMAIAIGFALASAILMVVMPEPLIRLFLDGNKPEAEQVVLYALPLLIVAAAFQLVDSAQAIGLGLLRGIKDTKVPMLMALISYWPIGLFLAYWVGIRLEYGGVGVWIGLATGLGLAAILMNARFFLRQAA